MWLNLGDVLTWTVFLMSFGLSSSDAAEGTGAWFGVPSNEEAWSRLPRATRGRNEALPGWARALALPLPTATAALLELDGLQRSQNSLEPRFRAKLRWVAARANGCEFAARTAKFDLERAGGRPDELETIAQQPESVSEKERLTYEFVTQLCRESAAITDREAARMLELHGAKDFAGVVLLTAYANFQDRLLAGLGLGNSSESPLPPPLAKFDWDAVQKNPPAVPARAANAKASDDAVPNRVPDADWQTMTVDDLKARLEQQKSRRSRIPVVSAEETAKFIRPDLYPPAKAALVIWHDVTFPYQPELTNAWFFASRRFREDSQFVDSFRQSMFWVVTRSVQCDYCMGHTLMLMEVAGVDQEAIEQRVCTLASGDWSEFAPPQRMALHFARRLTQSPSKVSRSEIEQLKSTFGAERTLDFLFHVSWCNFMVRISNAFQMPLERENVFLDMYNKDDPVSKTRSQKPAR